MYKNMALTLLSILLSLSSVTSLPAAQSQDCGLKRYASIDLVDSPRAKFLVPVTVEGTRGFMFLNTASPFSSMTESAANRLALQTRQMPSGAQVRSGGRSIERVATANGFTLGTVQFKSADFVIINNNFSSGAEDVQVMGILGMDVFANIDIELDLANRKMNLFSQDHCAGHAVYWSKTFDSVPIRFGQLGEFYFPMELEGKKLETTLATGNSLTSLSTDVTRKLYNFDGQSPDVETETDAAGRTTAHYRAMKLSGEGIQIINAHILLVDRPPNDGCHLGSRSGAAAYEGCFGAHPLQLGQSVLTKLHIYIATKEKVLYFTPAAAADQH